MQVVIPPAEGGLDDVMELTQVKRPRSRQPPPNRWLDLGQGDPHLHCVGLLERDEVSMPAKALRAAGKSATRV
ncbi:MAG: hypothetical protein M3069_19005 [Chloroflexota bacterium]|nr:hypothetical protein [Chloroflexota bacterium]